MKRDGGIDLLEREDKETAENFMNQLNEYGLFVVRKGELESWLPHLEAPRDKKKWLPGIFEKMGANPDDEDYVKPAEGDVWDFIGQIQSWCASPKRRGLPD